MRAARLAGIAAALGAVAACGGEEEASGDPQACREEPGVACVWAGVSGELGSNGDLDRRETMLYWPIDIAFAADGTPWFSDWNNYQIRRVRPDDTVETVVGTGIPGDLTEPSAPGLSVSLNHPTDIDFRDDGTVVFAAWHNHKLVEIDPASGEVTILCGSSAGYLGDGGPIEDAMVNQPRSIALDSLGRLHILDQRNFRIRRVETDGTVTTIAGTGTAGFSGDGGPASEAQLSFEGGGNPEPSGALAIGPDDTIYIGDGLNHRIRRIDPETGVITTIAGTGEPGYSGDGGDALAARFHNVQDLEFGPDGRLYVADADNHVIRAIDLESGVVETVAGSGTKGLAADGLPAREVELYRPFGIGFDAEGALYIVDTFNSRILKVPQ